jgi:lipopolysaccharide export LptBFGC system permease protein LptF
MKLTKEHYWIIGLGLVLVVFILFAGNKQIDNNASIKSLKDNKKELQATIDKSKSIVDSLQKRIVLYDNRYKELLKIKSKTITEYETRIKEIGALSTISNDSVSKYIASKIYIRQGR